MSATAIDPQPVKHQTSISSETSNIKLHLRKKKSVPPAASSELEGELGSASTMRSSFCFGSSWPSLDTKMANGLKSYRW